MQTDTYYQPSFAIGALETELIDFLAAAAIRHGATIATSRLGSEESNQIKMSITVSPDFLRRPEAVAFARSYIWGAEYLGLRRSDLGAVFKHGGETYAIHGADFRCPLTPIVARNTKTAQLILFSTAQVNLSRPGSSLGCRASLGIGEREKELKP